MSESVTKPTTGRKLIDVSPIITEIEENAIKDSAALGELYTIADYVRAILTGYLELKKNNPDITPRTLQGLKI